MKPMELWVLFSLLKALEVFAVGTMGGTRLKPLNYTVYILKSDDDAMICMGIIIDSITVVTAAHCKVQPSYLVKLASLPETETECDIPIDEVKTIPPPDTEVGVSILRLRKPLTVIAEKNQALTAVWNFSNEYEVGQPGIVPAIGYPPKAVGLELVDKTICKEQMLEIIHRKGWDDLDFPETVMCARKAREPVSTMMAGDVVPGMTCEHLGAPFILSGNDQVLGLLIYADCHTSEGSSMAFFVMAKDIPYATNPEAEETKALPLGINIDHREIVRRHMKEGILRNAGSTLIPLSTINIMTFGWRLFSSE